MTSVRIHEVGPRDGLQAEAAHIPVDVKAEFCRRLVDAGVTSLEVTSFVSPQWVPQLADAEDLMARLRRDAVLDGIRSMVLTPNRRGYDRAIAAGATEIAVFVSATETFARRNLNTTVDGALRSAADVVAAAVSAGIPVRGYVSMCFGDPWEGAVPVAQTVAVTQRLLDMGCSSVSLGDTIGVATPGQVTELLQVLANSIDRIAVHFHDTYGQALANTLAAEQMGVWQHETSVAGLGGCPYAKGATGNVATEDVLYMMQGLGIATGIDLDALVHTSLWMPQHTGHPPASRTAVALAARRTTEGMT